MLTLTFTFILFGGIQKRFWFRVEKTERGRKAPVEWEGFPK